MPILTPDDSSDEPASDGVGAAEVVAVVDSVDLIVNVEVVDVENVVVEVEVDEVEVDVRNVVVD
jgi:hypothetical protein